MDNIKIESKRTHSVILELSDTQIVALRVSLGLGIGKRMCLGDPRLTNTQAKFIEDLFEKLYTVSVEGQLGALKE